MTKMILLNSENDPCLPGSGPQEPHHQALGSLSEQR